MERPKDFDSIIGHDWLVDYFKNHLSNKTLPHFIILEGPEGLGKTSLADIISLHLVYGSAESAEYAKAYETVVKKKLSNDYIKKFELSVDGGKDAAREVRSEMQATFTLNKPKVIICDECHNLSDAAQDVFLSDTEYTNSKVYIIMLTTEIERLKPSLKSRAITLRLHPLKHNDMVRVLKREVAARNLKIQNEDITLGLIAEWSECKPRTGLNILNAFSNGSSISSNAIQELLGYLNITDVTPLLSALSGSMTFGLSYISEMKIDSSLVGLVIEALRVKQGESSYKLKRQDVIHVRESLVNVSADQLVKFLYGITRSSKISRVDVINAFIRAHSNSEIVFKHDTTDTLDIEKSQKANVVVSSTVTAQNKAPELETLLLNSQVVF